MKQLAWAVMFLAAAVPGRVEADCGIPHWFGAANGTHLPLKGSIYLHHEILRYSEAEVLAPVIAWTGASSSVAVTQVSDAVVRIDYDAPHSFAAELRVAADDYYDPTNVVLDPQWRRPAKAPRVVQYWHDVDHWACSWNDTVSFQLDQPVAAVRVRWTFGGETKEWIEAPRSDESTMSVIALGKINCGSSTVDPEELAIGGRLELIAIRFDRSEIAVTGVPVRLSSADMPSGEGDRTLHLDTLTPVEATAPTVAAPPAPESPPSRAIGLIVLGLLGLGVAFGVRRSADYLR
jgi:hypothetical protein